MNGKNKRRGLGYALLGAAATALVFVTATAVAGSGIGGIFNLGETNSVNAQSTLTGTSTGSQLRVVNGNTAGIGVLASHTGTSGSGAAIEGTSAAKGAPGIFGSN